ncbi:TetR family transcriptional regulator [Thalassobacillus devorans]|uniref:TetR family transcriptional regulator n=1 Tax=Thalassobacillus devorans TaxID=279813 RepID=A0ABQ1PLJ0_9BACI|nr:TetR family transcriptional regulator [Thalassobacillus devorans]NIK30223.1 AcrR family transcriptional regulator [Thalassobacillus devorans]GGC99322.1 TetR family transcriptional regulator [Thalassobacillus devorans]
MPRQTFFNLPEEKKQILIHSAEKEFSRVPLFEASIANIIKVAGIPRGSFYQYFEGKEDIYFYLLDKMAKQRKDKFIVFLQDHDGDLIEAMVAMFECMLHEEEHINFMRNAFLNMTHKVEHSFLGIFSDEESIDDFNEVSAQIDKRKLNIAGDQELYHIMQILTAVTFRNFVEKFAQGLSEEQAIETYQMEMNLLKKGIYIG